MLTMKPYVDIMQTVLVLQNKSSHRFPQEGSGIHYSQVSAYEQNFSVTENSYIYFG